MFYLCFLLCVIPIIPSFFLYDEFLVSTVYALAIFPFFCQSYLCVVLKVAKWNLVDYGFFNLFLKGIYLEKVVQSPSKCGQLVNACASFFWYVFDDLV